VVQFTRSGSFAKLDHLPSDSLQIEMSFRTSQAHGLLLSVDIFSGDAQGLLEVCTNLPSF